MEWTRRPEDQVFSSRYRMARTPTKGALQLVILSHDVLGTKTHYKNRTRPCIGLECEYCMAGERPRWHGYIIGICLRTNERLIVELPAGAAQRVSEWFDQHRTLKGSRVQLKRATEKANGRVIVSMLPPASGQGDLEKCPDIVPIMERMWEIHSHTNKARQVTPAVPQLRATGTDDSSVHLD